MSMRDIKVERKYVIHPGFVVSRSDGDNRYISAAKLMELYGVSPRDCIVIPHGHDGRGYLLPADAIHLYPRHDGNYTMETP